MNSTEPKKLPIQNYIWESLEAALKAESRRLIRDIAKTLGKDENEFARHIGNPSFSAYFVDMTEPTNEVFQCNAYCLDGPIQQPCRKPVIYGQTKCPQHIHHHPKPSSQLPLYKLLSYYDDDESQTKYVYLNPATNEVFDQVSLRQIGTWNSETQTLRLFVN